MEMNKSFIFNLIELIIAVICIVLADMIGSFFVNAILVYGTIVGFTIICTVILIGHIMGWEMEKHLNGAFDIIGCILFLVSGALIVAHWYDQTSLYGKTKDKALAAGCLMIINGHIMGWAMEKNLNCAFDIIGCILFLGCGALILAHWYDQTGLYCKTKDRALAAGYLMIINGILFLVDAVFIFKG